MPWCDFELVDRAADAYLPNLASDNGKRGFSHHEWDSIYGLYDAVIEPAEFFAKHPLKFILKQKESSQGCMMHSLPVSTSQS